jgi:hypothetical protein
MRKPFKIGLTEYTFKKDAIAHYRTILNSYNFGQSLSNTDFDELIDLLDYANLNSFADIESSGEECEEEIQNDIEIIDSKDTVEDELLIEDIKVSKVQFNTKCFEIFYNDKTSEYISYLMILNNTSYTPEKLFYAACRNSIYSDIRSVKKEYFDKNSIKGLVKCQETGIQSKWTELAVDHRQPNTFSIIVDRFKEVSKIDLDVIEYTSNDQNHIVFQNENLTESFKKYHKEKASLRIVRIECNSSRTGMARIKRTTKDLTIK